MRSSIRTVPDEQLHDGIVAPLRGQHQRVHPLVVPLVHVRAGPQQRLHHPQVPLLSRSHQGRRAWMGQPVTQRTRPRSGPGCTAAAGLTLLTLEVRPVDSGVVLEQQLDHGRVSEVRGLDERRRTADVRDVHIGLRR